MLAAQVNQAVVVEDRLAEVPTIGVFVFAILTLFHRKVDGRGQARLGGGPDIEAEQLPGGPAVTGPPDIPHQAIIDHRPSAPTPVPVPPGIGPEQFAIAWPIGLELVAPTHLLVDQGQFTQHRQLRQIGQVDHRQENIGIGLFRFLLTIIIPFATFRDRLWRIGRLEILGLQQVQLIAVNRGAGEVGRLRQNHAAKRGIGIILQCHPDGRPALLAEVPVGALSQLQQIVARWDDLVDGPR